jgi:hypothetical protein
VTRDDGWMTNGGGRESGRPRSFVPDSRFGGSQAWVERRNPVRRAGGPATRHAGTSAYVRMMTLGGGFVARACRRTFREIMYVVRRTPVVGLLGSRGEIRSLDAITFLRHTARPWGAWGKAMLLELQDRSFICGVYGSPAGRDGKMRQVRYRIPMLFALFFAAACTDSPTGPDTANSRGTGPNRIWTWYMPGVVVVGTPEECDPWMDLNWCEGGGAGGGECMESVGVNDPEAMRIATAGGCTGTGGGGGGTPVGGGTTSPPPESGDTCRTGNEILDSPDVQAGLRDIWTRSNPSAPQSSRLEQGGWIVQRPDGTFGMAAFSITAQGPCNINGNLNAPPGAIAFVHTHPFQRDEVQAICGPVQQRSPVTGAWQTVFGPDGQPLLRSYDNTPSIPDRELLQDVNAARTSLGQTPVVGVIIDANQTTGYTENPSDGSEPYRRCGY